MDAVENPVSPKVDAYSRSVVSYIDILGFADLINSTGTDKSRIAAIVGVLTEMKKIADGWQYIHRPADNPSVVVRTFRSFTFSDHIVRSTGIPDDSPVADRIYSELFHLCYAQLTLALQGFLVRGGVCIGEIFVDVENAERDVVFGPALVKAYRLESQSAVYPRIVIDRAMIRDAQQEGYEAQIQDYTRRGEDGAYFLDYLLASSLTGFAVPGAPPPKPQIEAHRKMIEDKIHEGIHLKNERLKQKYMWLGLYHNSTVHNPRLWDKLSAESVRFVIPENLLDF